MYSSDAPPLHVSTYARTTTKMCMSQWLRPMNTPQCNTLAKSGQSCRPVLNLPISDTEIEVSPTLSMRPSFHSLVIAEVMESLGSSSTLVTSLWLKPAAKNASKVSKMSSRSISFVSKGFKASYSCLVHMRMHTPGDVRPVRPCRCSAEALEIFWTSRVGLPVLTSMTNSLCSRVSITQVTSGIVMELSAMFVDTTTRTPWNADVAASTCSGSRDPCKVWTSTWYKRGSVSWYSTSTTSSLSLIPATKMRIVPILAPLTMVLATSHARRAACLCTNFWCGSGSSRYSVLTGNPRAPNFLTGASGKSL
mmetsp:Transcript_33131/g.64997  ORF Transcript_33131/g.64997 Transcript_33131/m.64997 type:complete len:307 (-) Transcript_33131:1047-1967(-)